MEQRVAWQEVGEEMSEDAGLLDSKLYEDYLKSEILCGGKKATTYLHLAILAWGEGGDQERAFTNLRFAEEIDPSDVRIYYWRARIYYEVGANEEARRELAKLSQKTPQLPEALLLSGELEGAVGRGWQGALPFFEKALLLAPDWPMIWLSLGLAYLRLGDLVVAEEHFNMVKELGSIAQKECLHAVEKYFEKNVTGRGCEHMIERMDYWQYRVARSY